jgi:RNA polymerase-binding protein
MADRRAMRGSRLGGVSYETDRNRDLAPRQIARYRTENGEEFDIPFADEAQIPVTWLCRNGMEGRLIEGGELAEPKQVKVPRTHWECCGNAARSGNSRNCSRNASRSSIHFAAVASCTDHGRW